jgi:probable F420-dependent oxidoreductase
VKVRIAYGLGAAAATVDAGRFGALVDGLEDVGFDSLWLSERLTGSSPDPLVGLAVAAGRTNRLKLGTSVLVLPGRNTVVLAKELASLDVLSGGRLLPAVGLGAPLPVEHHAFGVARSERAALFDESLAVMRRLWRGDDVDGIRLALRPIQDPFDVWLGGRAPSELRRVGRVGDGWLPSFSSPEEVAEGWEVITAAAATHDRRIDPEHLGALVVYAEEAIPDGARKLLERRRGDVDPTSIVPVGLEALRRQLEAFIAVGASKFVVVPVGTVDDVEAHLRELGDALLDLET